MSTVLAPVSLAAKVTGTAVVLSGAVVAMAGIAVVSSTISVAELGWDAATDTVRSVKRAHARSARRRQGVS